jgi:hypothetical protein
MTQDLDALAALRAANPVQLDSLPDGASPQAHHLLASIVPNRRRRYVAFGSAALASALICGVALAASVIRRDFFEAPAGPETIRRSFSELDRAAPQDMQTRVIAEETRRIDVPIDTGGSRPLFIAPTSGGGYCTASSFGGGCRIERRPSPDAVARLNVRGKNSWMLGVSMFVGPAKTTIYGDILDERVSELDVRLADGTLRRIPFVWISEPISAGFFFYDDLADDRSPEPEAVIARGDDGVIAATRVETLQNAGSDRIPGRAIRESARELLSITTQAGREVSLVVARATGGGTCYWTTRGHGCVDSQSDTSALFPLLSSGSEPMLLWGPVPPGASTLELRFQDGVVKVLVPTEGLVLAEIPRAQYARGRRLREIVARDVGGAVLRAQAIQVTDDQMYPCVPQAVASLFRGLRECDG